MGSVYKVTDGELVYYGSTIMPLTRRLTCHKSPSNNCATNKLNRDNLTIELVSWVEDVEQLKVREKWFIENNECVNIILPFTTKEEKLAQHRVISSNYYYANKEKTMAANKRWRAHPYNCPCGSNITNGEKCRHNKSKKHINYINSL